jgi:hypothetical protein
MSDFMFRIPYQYETRCKGTDRKVLDVGNVVEGPATGVGWNVCADNTEIDSVNDVVFRRGSSENRLLLSILSGMSCGTSGSNRSCIGDSSLLSCRLI